MNFSLFIAWSVYGLIALSSFLAPLFSGEGSLFLIAFVATYTAYRGFSPSIVYRIFFVLLTSEALYGFSVGIFSLAYVLSVAVLYGCTRFITFIPWAYTQGWSMVDMLKTIFVSGILYGGILFWSVPLGALLYGTGLVVLRWESFMHTSVGVLFLVTSVLTSIALRRTEVPFRRTIHYGV